MTKKPSKEIKSIPNIYQIIVNRDPAHLKLCLVEDVHEGLYLFDKPEECHIITSAIAHKWSNHDAFEAENKQTLLARHANAFKSEPPKDQSLRETSVWLWYYYCQIAVDRTKNTLRAESGRKSTILSSKYMLGETLEGNGDLRTPQAITCLKIFRETINARQDADTTAATAANVPLPTNYEPTLTEEELRKAICDRAAELHTKQDPWRIFQYYRPNLISSKLVRRVS